MASLRLETLTQYTACDISDALLKLEVPGAGYLADIGPVSRFLPSYQAQSSQTPLTASTAPVPLGLSSASEDPALTTTSLSQPQQGLQPSQKVIARASTILFTPHSSPSFPTESSATSSLTGIIKNAFMLPDANISSSTPFSDLTLPDTVVIIEQPAGQVCAVVGGIHAVRMKIMGARGIIVEGRVRDLSTLVELGIPVWSKATSTIGSAAEARAWAAEVPVRVGSVTVYPGDIIMIDPAENGAVCIPTGKLDDVLALLPKLTAADEKVIIDVGAGMSVGDAFKRHRQ